MHFVCFYIGVGVLNPSYKLDVNGTINGLAIYQNGFPLMPTGAILSYAGTSAPGGWFVCDGALISRTSYVSLFSIISVLYGAGDGVNTFQLPDMRGRSVVGAGQGSTLSNRDLASIGGTETHALNVNEIPSHTHNGTTNVNGSHTHTHNANNLFPGACLAYRNGVSTRVDVDNDGPNNEINLDASAELTINSDGNHTHTFTTDATGGNGAHNNMHPYFVLNYIIKY